MSTVTAAATLPEALRLLGLSGPLTEELTRHWTPTTGDETPQVAGENDGARH
ncbi:hypothetical protein ABZ619_03635 [Streptomyces sp. NPDC007851]|uniref:hypothetical protein n=1 Tax=Streptomyces sp. NPDC007851 TaxID=3155008 RepID=UPI0033D8F5A5